MYRSALLCCIVMVMVFGTLRAQPPVWWRIGVGLQAEGVLHRADFAGLPGIPVSEKAGTFTGSTALGYGVTGSAEWQMFDAVALGIHADIRYAGGVLTAREGPVPVADGNGETLLTFEHTIERSLLSMGIRPVVVFSPVEPLRLHIGARVGAVLTSSFEQAEAIVDPPGHEYVGGGNRRIRATGTSLPEAPAIDLALCTSVGYDISLSPSLVVHPSLSYRVGLTDQAAGIHWKTDAVSGGVALHWLFRRDKEMIIDTVYRRDTTVRLAVGVTEESIVLAGETVQVEDTETEDFRRRQVLIHQSYIRTVPRPAPLLSAGLEVRFVLKDGRETEGVNISVETLVENTATPLLPYIFFDSSDAAIPSRYPALTVEETSRFSPKSANRSTFLDIYRQLLNIVGMRLRARPGSRLVLTGTNSDEGAEKRNLALSRQRAEAVRDYLVKTWGIDADRLVVQAVNLPSSPSNSSLPGGNEENRRVELTSSDPDILAPVVLRDTVRAANPPVVRFYPRVLSEAGVERWQILIGQGERRMQSFTGEGAPPDFVDWNIDQDKSVLVSADAPVQYRFRVHDLEGQTVETEEGSIVFQINRQETEQLADRGEVTRYSLIVFDYDGSELTQVHRSALAAIRRALPAQADIAVVGMTDVLGDADYNRLLSERRAKAIASALHLPASAAVGIGEQTEIPSTTPEGRFYSRRVDILIRRNNSP